MIVFLDILMSTSSKCLSCGSPADRHLVHLRSPHRRLFVSWADDISSGNLLSVEDLATKKTPTRYHRVYHSYRYISYIQYHQISGSSIHLTAWNMGILPIGYWVFASLKWDFYQDIGRFTKDLGYFYITNIWINGWWDQLDNGILGWSYFSQHFFRFSDSRHVPVMTI